jgi:signal transduction histidine kinase
VDGWLDRVYARHGARYPVLLLGFVYLTGALAVGPALALFPIRYEGLSLGQAAIALLVTEAGLLIAVGTGFLASWSSLRALRRWGNGQRDGATRKAARRAAFGLPARMLVGSLAAAPFAPGFVILVTSPVHHTAAVDIAEIGIGEAVAASFFLLSVYLMLDVGLRPIRASVSAPATPRGAVSRLSARLLSIVLFLVFIGVCAGGFWVQHRGPTPAGHFMDVLPIAAGFTLLSAVIVAPLLAGTVLSPIRRLIRGTRAVGSGALDAEVPVASNDELGELSQSFNTMVSGLRERSELREHNAQLVEELRASRARVVAAADTERRALERDLHDGAQQQLVLLGLKLGMAGRLIDSDPAAARALHEELKGELELALRELRDLAHGIYPPLLESEGLRGALDEATKRATIAVSLECDGIGRYPSELEAAVYFCCREALQNASKHAGETARATVRLRQDGGALSFEVSDDGRGFDPAATRISAGTQNMTDRIGALGGSVKITSAPGQGTTIAGTIPLD